MMQAHRDRVRADHPRIARGAARAHVLDVDRVLDDEAGAIRGRAFRHDTLEDGRRPVRAENFVRGQQRPRAFDRFPAGDLRQKCFVQPGETHARNSAGQRVRLAKKFP